MSDERALICERRHARMRRRDLLAALGGVVAWPRIARAQQPRMHQIGYLYAGSDAAPTLPSFRQGLAEMGYVDGRNIAFEIREAHNDLSLLPALARDLVGRRVDVIAVTGSVAAALAAKAATATIPIVFNNASDPIKAGLVTSLNRPGGNITGIIDFGVMLSAKRLEFIKLLIPGASRIALLVAQPNSPGAAREIGNAREGARSLGIDILVQPAGTAEEIDPAFAVLARERADGVCVIPHNVLFESRMQIVALAARHRVPGVYPFIQFAQAGGLMSYGSNLAERNRQAARYVGLILNGTDPADLPVRRFERFELAINMTTAKALGLTVPPSFLALTDKVIE